MTIKSILLLLDDIATYLNTCSIGTVSVDLFKGYFPNTPDNAVCIMATGGSPTRSKNLIEPTTQIFVRGTDSNFATTFTKVNTIYGLLDDRPNVLATIHGRCKAMHPPGPYYIDSNGRKVFTLNFMWTNLKE